MGGVTRIQPRSAARHYSTSLSAQGLGQNVFSPSGHLNPGTLSINRHREAVNGFKVNGSDAEEPGSMAARPRLLQLRSPKRLGRTSRASMTYEPLIVVRIDAGEPQLQFRTPDPNLSTA